MSKHKDRIGRIWLQGPDGRVQETVLYDAPLRHRVNVLHIRGGVYELFGQHPNGTWIYRYNRRAPHSDTDRDLKDFRNDQHPQWDGPVACATPATWDDVLEHFKRLAQETASRSHGLTTAEFDHLYAHFRAAQQGRPF